MLNLFSFICICLNSVLSSRNFFFTKLPFESNGGCYASNPYALFSISLCLASCCKFLMRS